MMDGLVSLSDYPNYFINQKGEVFKLYNSEKLKKLSIFVDDYGYNRVSLRRENGSMCVQMVHRLVYKTFVGNLGNSKLIFLDGNRSNCNVENLKKKD